MRFAPTRSEALLWRVLSGSKTGLGFRRQLVIGHRIVDFACPKARLVVEVDGTWHHGREHRDAARDAELAELGWHVLHVTEAQVFAELEAVVCSIVHAAEERA